MAAIFLSAAVGPLFTASHPFIFNFGGEGDGASTSVMVSVLLQVFAELVVDGVALRVEAGQGLPMTSYFAKLDRPVMVVSRPCPLQSPSADPPPVRRYSTC